VEDAGVVVGNRRRGKECWGSKDEAVDAGGQMVVGSGMYRKL